MCKNITFDFFCRVKKIIPLLIRDANARSTLEKLEFEEKQNKVSTSIANEFREIIKI